MANRYRRHQASREQYPFEYNHGGRLPGYGMAGVHGRRPSAGSFGYPTHGGLSDSFNGLHSIKEEGRRGGSESALYQRYPHLQERRGSEDLYRDRRRKRPQGRSRDYIPPNERDLSRLRNAYPRSMLPDSDNGYSSDPARRSDRELGSKKVRKSRSSDNTPNSTLTTRTTGTTEQSTETGYDSGDPEVTETTGIRNGIIRNKSQETLKLEDQDKPSADVQDATTKPSTHAHSVTITEPERRPSEQFTSSLRRRRKPNCSGCTFFKYFCVAIFVCILGLISFGIYYALKETVLSSGVESEEITETDTTTVHSVVRRSLYHIIAHQVQKSA